MKKEFVVPKVLQVCEVMLEENLLGPSQAMQATGFITTGQEVTTDTSDSANEWTAVAGDTFD